LAALSKECWSGLPGKKTANATDGRAGAARVTLAAAIPSRCTARASRLSLFFVRLKKTIAGIEAETRALCGRLLIIFMFHIKPSGNFRF
jgi:hypothetical protein